MIFALYIAHNHAYTVTVGVGTDYQIDIFLFRHVNRYLKALFVLRIGRFYGREVTILGVLLFYNDYIFKAYTL